MESPRKSPKKSSPCKAVYSFRDSSGFVGKRLVDNLRIIPCPREKRSLSVERDDQCAAIRRRIDRVCDRQGLPKYIQLEFPDIAHQPMAIIPIHKESP